MILLENHLPNQDGRNRQERKNNWQGTDQRICTLDDRGSKLAATRVMRRGRMKIRCVRCQISGERRTCSAEAGEGMGKEGNGLRGWTGSQSQGAGGKRWSPDERRTKKQTQGRARGRSTDGADFIWLIDGAGNPKGRELK